MKTKFLAVLVGVFSLYAFVVFSQSKPAEAKSFTTFQYATIRWGGRDNTHVIRPSGQVEFVGSDLKSVKKPDRADERSFYMNVLMNALGREGYEFAGMTSDEIVMKKPVAPAN